MKQRDVHIDAVYPNTLPCPSAEGFSVNYEPDLEQTKMQSGWTRSRRMTPYMYKTLTLVFRMDSSLYPTWHDFVHAHMNKWVSMQILTDVGLSLQPVRITSPASHQYDDWGLVSVSVQGEVLLTP